MARQAGPIYFTGTIDDLTFYKMDGQYYARKKSSLDRRQFRNDPRFARSRNSAAMFGEASKLASAVYSLLPKEARSKGVIGKLTGQIGGLLRAGQTPQQVMEHFQQQYGSAAGKPAAPPQVKDTVPVESRSSTWQVTPNGKLVGQQSMPTLWSEAIDFFPGSACARLGTGYLHELTT